MNGLANAAGEDLSPISTAITNAGVATSEDDEIETMASNIGNIIAGNAEVGQVLDGYTFSSVSAGGRNKTGNMPNNGAWTGSTSGNGNISIPAGYHNGSGYVSGANSYNSGYEADSISIVDLGTLTWSFGVDQEWDAGDHTQTYTLTVDLSTYVKDVSKININQISFSGFSCNNSTYGGDHMTVAKNISGSTLTVSVTPWAASGQGHRGWYGSFEVYLVTTANNRK